ncbi:MAG: TrpR-like protein [Lawsonibacter sp.]|jgi:TrpR-related protein YerC/YecD|nr:TrpR-like protein [Lawsonibacter sp.]MCI9294126.1 TrpR-like protein [Lawsonibacter sp.]MDE6898687.1 TrpR-like protein [Lawsonibacter sp.]
MSKFLDKQSSDALYRAIVSIQDEEECRKFLEDLCTVSELKAMAQRIDVAILLDKGLIYSEILDKTGASSATISRVNRCLHYGAGGYQAVVPRLREETV